MTEILGVSEARTSSGSMAVARPARGRQVAHVPLLGIASIAHVVLEPRLLGDRPLPLDTRAFDVRVVGLDACLEHGARLGMAAKDPIPIEIAEGHVPDGLRGREPHSCRKGWDGRQRALGSRRHRLQQELAVGVGRHALCTDIGMERAWLATGARNTRSSASFTLRAEASWGTRAADE